MKAIQVHRFGEPDVMEIRDVPALKPSGNQVLIDVRAIGVNPVDTYIRAGIYPTAPEPPFTPGFDAAGVITAVGENVTHRKVGDRVYCFGSETGCYAEQIICREDQVYLLPDKVDFKAGAALGVPYSTAYYAIFYRAHALPGETMLVHGASGGVGLAALQIARAAGIRVFGTAGSETGLELIKQQGAHAAFNHYEEGYLGAIPELTCGQGLDVILEMLANVNLAKDLDSLGKFGRVVVIGNRGSIEIDPRAAMGRNASVLGMSLFNTSKDELRTIHAAIYAGLENGTLSPVIHTEVPLSEATRAHVEVMESGAQGKILLIP